MNDFRISPEQLKSMAEVRAEVDGIDREIAALIGDRFRLMEAAARIKPERTLVRDEARKAEVIANARRNALINRYPEDLAATLWETLVEASIAYEFEVFDQR